MKAERVFLVGFMGSGKTRVGKLLAKRLGWRWLDLDKEVEKEAGCTVAQLFEREGEAGFRERERDALRACIQAEEVVVSCGGGVILDPENRQLLIEQPHCFCLRIKPETVFRRVGNDPRRPLLQSDHPYERIKELMHQRAPLYKQFPRQIDVDAFRTSEIVDQIFPMLGIE